MGSNHGYVLGITLDQRVAKLLALRRGRWCCDSCLALALDRSEQHAVEYITDSLATNGSYRRSWDACADCQRGKLVTMAN
jgi:hypothetical protein